MLNMSTAGYMGARSPDRVDAMVYSLSELHLEPENRFTVEALPF
jgi:phage terminase large subunit-like protein